MKYIFFIIAIILFLIGTIIFWGYMPFGKVHLLFIGACTSILIGIIYNVYKKNEKIKNQNKSNNRPF